MKRLMKLPISTVLLAAVLVAIGTGCQTAISGDDNMAMIEESFDQGMDNWWVEGGEKVWVEDGRLHMKANPPEKGPGYVCTAWCRTPIEGNARIEFDAHVVASEIDANNINFFFYYSDPSGESLFETRDDRPEADYRKYHVLNGYIVTFLKDFRHEGGTHPDGAAKARFRLRRCPGFNLIDETFASHCEKGVTYRCAIVKKDGTISFSVDGNQYLQAVDSDPLRQGLIGLRTFRTYLWWDNIRVTPLD